MEQITKHEYLDVYRIADGVLLNVKKYKVLERSWGYWKYQKDKTVVKKLEGLKNLYRAIKDVDDEWYPIKIGDMIYDGYKITSVINPTEYRFEIKTTGESFSGDYKDMNNYMYVIIEIMDRYLLEG